MPLVDCVWLFDVDGVITHPEEKRITEPQILDKIVKRLQKGEAVALVTGRSLSWLIERVIDLLEERISDRTILQNFFAVGEKGGAWISYQAQGQREEFIDSSISTSPVLQGETRKIIEEQFSETMFIDESKHTMISTEMRDGLTVSAYRIQQQKLNRMLEGFLQKYDLQNRFKLDPSTIATDIMDKRAGKALGARKVLQWLREKQIVPKQFLVFGDSKHDLEMVQELHGSRLSVKFIFVGKEADRKYLESQNLPFPVTFTQNNYEKGTLEYLNSISRHANRQTRFV